MVKLLLDRGAKIDAKTRVRLTISSHICILYHTYILYYTSCIWNVTKEDPTDLRYVCL